MADDTNPRSNAPEPAPAPGSRPPDRQALLDDVYARAAAIRRRRASWVGAGCGLAAVIVVAGLLAVVPDRDPDGVLMADLADSTGSTSTMSTMPATTRTVVSSASSAPSSETTATSETSVPPNPTHVPDEDDPVVTVPPDTGPTTTPETTVPRNSDPTVEIVSVTPESPQVGEEVTVTVRVVDADTELDACLVSWGDQQVVASCPTPGCTGEGYDDPPTGSTDRTDTFSYTYAEPGTYEVVFEYQGNACTSYWEHERRTTKIQVSSATE